MQKLIYYYGLIYMLSNVSACSKKPEDREKGKSEFFNCRINGKSYNPPLRESDGFKGYNVSYLSGHGDSSLLIVGKQVGLYLFDTPLHKNTVYQLGIKKPGNSSAGYHIANLNKNYRTNELYRGEVTLTHFDSLWVAGDFYFEAVDSLTKERVRIDEGVFSFKRKP